MELHAQRNTMVTGIRRPRAAWVVALGLLMSALPLIAAEVVLAVPVSVQPYYIPHRDAGLTYETIQTAFAARGYRLAPVYVSGRHIERLLEEDPRVDCAGMVSEELARRLSAIERVPAFHDQVVTLAVRSLSIEEVGDLANANLIAFTGAREVLGEDFRRMADANPRYREVNNHRAQVKLLLKGRVDAIVADRRLVQWYLDHVERETGVRHQVAFHPLFPPARGRFACRDEDLTRELDEGLRIIEQDGRLEAIRAKYR